MVPNEQRWRGMRMRNLLEFPSTPLKMVRKAIGSIYLWKEQQGGCRISLTEGPKVDSRKTAVSDVAGIFGFALGQEAGQNDVSESLLDLFFPSTYCHLMLTSLLLEERPHKDLFWTRKQGLLNYAALYWLHDMIALVKIPSVCTLTSLFPPNH